MTIWGLRRSSVRNCSDVDRDGFIEALPSVWRSRAGCGVRRVFATRRDRRASAAA
jgi:hypothetical protein